MEAKDWALLKAVSEGDRDALRFLLAAMAEQIKDDLRSLGTISSKISSLARKQMLQALEANLRPEEFVDSARQTIAEIVRVLEGLPDPEQQIERLVSGEIIMRQVAREELVRKLHEVASSVSPALSRELKE